MEFWYCYNECTLGINLTMMYIFWKIFTVLRLIWELFPTEGKLYFSRNIERYTGSWNFHQRYIDKTISKIILANPCKPTRSSLHVTTSEHHLSPPVGVSAPSPHLCWHHNMTPVTSNTLSCVLLTLLTQQWEEVTHPPHDKHMTHTWHWTIDSLRMHHVHLYNI